MGPHPLPEASKIWYADGYEELEDRLFGGWPVGKGMQHGEWAAQQPTQWSSAH